MKTTKDYAVMTLEQLRDELNDSIDAYNTSTDIKERVEMQVEHKKIVDAYNELSLHTTYALCLKDENPIIKLAQTYYYETISVSDKPHKSEVDGVIKSTLTRGISDGNKKLNVVKFIEWAAECNTNVTADIKWRSTMDSARKVVETQWKKFFESGKDSHSMSIGKTKKALQEMFDALVYIKSETGKNAIIANGTVAKWVLGFSNTRKDFKEDGKVKVTGSILSKQTWATLLLDILHMVVEKKTFDIVYGEEDAETEEVETEAESK